MHIKMGRVKYAYLCFTRPIYVWIIMQLCIACRFSGFAFFFKIGYNNTAAGIAGDIDNCTSHIKDSVDTCNQGNTVNRQTNGSQDHGSMTIPAPGTPAVPMEASVAVRTTVSIWVGVSVMP